MAEIYELILSLTSFVDNQSAVVLLCNPAASFAPNMSMCATLLQCAAIGDLNVSTQQMLAYITAK
jgi:hypothetical protein